MSFDKSINVRNHNQNQDTEVFIILKFPVLFALNPPLPNLSPGSS